MSDPRPLDYSPPLSSPRKQFWPRSPIIYLDMILGAAAMLSDYLAIRRISAHPTTAPAAAATTSPAASPQ